MFDGYIRDWAFWTPEAPAVVLPDRVVSYAAFDRDVDRLGAALAARGVRPGRGAVALRIAEPYLQRAVLAALARLGVASSGGDDDAAPLKLVYTRGGEARQVGPDALLLTRAEVEAALAAEVPPLPRVDPDPDAVVRIMLSSGTTRRPKRVAFTWARLEITTLTNLRVYGAVRKGVWAPLTGPDSLMGFSMTLCGWAIGGAVAAGFPGERLLELMGRHGEGVAVVTPAILRHLLSSLPEGFTPKPGWRLQVGGSALPATLAQAAAARITPDIWTGYGATESSRITAAPASKLADVPGAVGAVVASARVDIVDEAGAALPDGEAGELRVRSTRTAAGYVGDPAQTAERFRDGWYYTNDLARRLPDGRIVIEGRLDDRMNLGGRKVMPIQLERPVLAWPGVRDCAGFAAPGAGGLDAAWVAVAAEADCDRAGLAAHLAGLGHLPRCWLLWVDEIPRNAMGKVERVKLREVVVGQGRV